MDRPRVDYWIRSDSEAFESSFEIVFGIQVKLGKEMDLEIGP